MFSNKPDYKKMEYTSNRLRKEFISLGRIDRQSARKTPYGKSLEPWEHLNDFQKEQCSFNALRIQLNLNKWWSKKSANLF